VSLIFRLKEHPQDQAAWREFVRRYEPRLRDWCRHWNLQEADARDVTQLVLLQLLTKLRSFEYDAARSFRGWLKTLAHHAWYDLIARRRQVRTNLGTAREEDPLDTLAARDDLGNRLEEAFDLELLELAKDRVQARVAPATWEAFRLMAEEDLSGAEAADRLRMPLQSVFKARQNVQKMLREEIERLEVAPMA
jgi:RNA polymerase sigma-70 factor (ECF subfamily)